MNKETLTILLIGNYPNDRQESMQRFARVLYDELTARGIHCHLIRPEPFFGKLQFLSIFIGKYLGYIDKFFVFPFRLKKAVSKLNRPYVVHICDHSNAFYTYLLQSTPHLITCNDLLAIRSALGEFPQNRTHYSGKCLQRLILSGLRKAQKITCISHKTHEDLLRVTQIPSERCSVTYMGLHYPYKAITPKKPNFPFLLHVGGNQWYKNRLGVLNIYHHLCNRMGQKVPHLIMVGKPFCRKIKRYLHQQSETPLIHCLNHVENEELQSLYSSAELLLFPSLEEGFGWPILEALSCGCRVVTSNRAPMTEVGGEAAIYIDPEREEEASKTILQALMETSVQRKKRIEKGLLQSQKFSTQEMVNRYIKLYATIKA